MTAISGIAPQTLADWLSWQESLHPSEIELGLDRVREVLSALALPALPAVITVAGTNGKGSTIAFMESMLRAAGYHTTAYTSPHLFHYNERIRLDGEPVDDARLCDAFARVDAARGEVPLTYFEFGTLAALVISAEYQPDVILLEAGLGGRLDAVNIIDADVAVVTSIGIDHVEWLGPDRASIAREKAGIMRSGRPAVCGEPDPPETLLAHARHLAVSLLRTGDDFHHHQAGHGWQYRMDSLIFEALPPPALEGDHQFGNAATAVTAVLQLAGQKGFAVTEQHIRQGLQATSLPGRCQTVRQSPEVVVDVGHNEHSARALADWLATRREEYARVRLVLGMLEDKDMATVIGLLCGQVDDWYPAIPDCARAVTPQVVISLFERAGLAARCEPESIDTVCRRALDEAGDHDLVLVTGSFYTVAEALPVIEDWVPGGELL